MSTARTVETAHPGVGPEWVVSGTHRVGPGDAGGPWTDRPPHATPTTPRLRGARHDVVTAPSPSPERAQSSQAIGAYEGEGNPHYHATSDTPETLDYEHYLTPVTRFTLATVLRQWLDTSAGSRVDRASGPAAQM